MIENPGEGNDTVFCDGRTLRSRRTWKTSSCKAAPTCKASATALANAIFGNSGNNLLDGGAGADVMIGGAGNDTYFVDNIGDQVIERSRPGQRHGLRLRSTTG